MTACRCPVWRTMKRARPLISLGIIALCFLYTGSAYMSQSFRLLELMDGRTVDVVTSIVFYLLQAAGICIFSAGLARNRRLWRSKRLFAALLAAGSVFMAVAQVADSLAAVMAASCLFNLLIGVYFGFYLAFFAVSVPENHAGIGFGCAYAFASVGTYCLSLVDDGALLSSHHVVVIYIVLSAGVIALALLVDDLPDEALPSHEALRSLHLPQLIAVIMLATLVFTIGSDLYYSVPIADGVNWSLIRAFYALGLIAAGAIMDRSRFLGEACAIASLAYPLIATALTGAGTSTVAALGAAYAMRGFITLYYVLSFSDLVARQHSLAALAPLGLASSRIAEVAATALLFSVPGTTAPLIIAAACFMPLIAVFVMLQNKRYANAPIADDKRLAIFASTYGLSAREAEILGYLAKGMTDAEIAEQAFISRNTVRFHVANILKKTGASSRVEASRLLKKI